MRVSRFYPAILACSLIFSGCTKEDPTLLSVDDNSNPAALPAGSNATPAPTWPPPNKPRLKRDRLLHPQVAAIPTVPPAPPSPNIATPVTAQVKTGGASDAGSSFDNLEIADASINRQLTVLRVGTERTDSNLLSVLTGLKNKTAHVLTVEVQTVYKDKVGNPIGEGNSWIPMILKPHAEAVYRSVSISSDAVDFLVRIRRPVNASSDTGTSQNQ